MKLLFTISAVKDVLTQIHNISVNTNIPIYVCDPIFLPTNTPTYIYTLSRHMVYSTGIDMTY